MVNYKCSECELVKSEPKNEIVVYQSNESVRIDVQLANDTVWLSILQMCQLFDRERSVIAKHLKNAMEEGELELGINVQNLHINRRGRPQALYDLDAVISAGYRVKSLRGTVWHIGASLKDAGSALFAMMKMELDPAVILSLMP